MKHVQLVDDRQKVSRIEDNGPDTVAAIISQQEEATGFRDDSRIVVCCDGALAVALETVGVVNFEAQRSGNLAASTQLIGDLFGQIARGGQQLNFIVGVGRQNGLLGDAVGFLGRSDRGIILPASLPEEAAVIFAEENGAGFAFGGYLLHVLDAGQKQEAHEFIHRRLTGDRQDFGIQWRQKSLLASRCDAKNGFRNDGGGNLADEFIDTDADMALQTDFELNVAGDQVASLQIVVVDAAHAAQVGEILSKDGRFDDRRIARNGLVNVLVDFGVERGIVGQERYAVRHFAGDGDFQAGIDAFAESFRRSGNDRTVLMMRRNDGDGPRAQTRIQHALHLKFEIRETNM